jgi:hypothetical protein
VTDSAEPVTDLLRRLVRVPKDKIDEQEPLEVLVIDSIQRPRPD